MSAISSVRETNSSIKPLIIYWLVGAVVGLLMYVQGDLSAPMEWSQSHVVSILIALLATVVTMVAYDRITKNGGRSLHLPTLFGFSIVNGICETVLFIASFVVGVELAKPLTAQPLWLFLAGTLTFLAYTGAIHAFFWLKILPPHLNKDPAVKGIRRVWIVGLTTMSLLWVWLYFGYQDVWSFALLHILFDAGMVYSIRYRLS